MYEQKIYQALLWLSAQSLDDILQCLRSHSHDEINITKLRIAFAPHSEPLSSETSPAQVLVGTTDPADQGTVSRPGSNDEEADQAVNDAANPGGDEGSNNDDIRRPDYSNDEDVDKGIADTSGQSDVEEPGHDNAAGCGLNEQCRSKPLLLDQCLKSFVRASSLTQMSPQAAIKSSPHKVDVRIADLQQCTSDIDFLRRGLSQVSWFLDYTTYEEETRKSKGTVRTRSSTYLKRLGYRSKQSCIKHFAQARDIPEGKVSCVRDAIKNGAIVVWILTKTPRLAGLALVLMLNTWTKNKPFRTTDVSDLLQYFGKSIDNATDDEQDLNVKIFMQNIQKAATGNIMEANTATWTAVQGAIDHSKSSPEVIEENFEIFTSREDVASWLIQVFHAYEVQRLQPMRKHVLSSNNTPEPADRILEKRPRLDAPQIEQSSPNYGQCRVGQQRSNRTIWTTNNTTISEGVPVQFDMGLDLSQPGININNHHHLEAVFNNFSPCPTCSIEAPQEQAFHGPMNHLEPIFADPPIQDYDASNHAGPLHHLEPVFTDSQFYLDENTRLLYRENDSRVASFLDTENCISQSSAPSLDISRHTFTTYANVHTSG